MDKHNIVVPMEDTTDPEQQSTLISIGGKKQVPCLVIGGEALYESDAIVAWLGEHMRGD
jgi:glutathione S-transferase